MEQAITLIVKKVATGGLTTKEGVQLLITLMTPIQDNSTNTSYVYEASTCNTTQIITQTTTQLEPRSMNQLEPTKPNQALWNRYRA